MKYKQAILQASILFLFPALASAATLSLSPSSQSVTVGQNFTVNVLLNAQGQAVDGVDISYLRYNPSLLQVQSATAGTLMPLTLSNNFATQGQIQFSQVASGGSSYTGQGTLLTIAFKALSQGTANVTFDFTSGNTQDTNVSGASTDLLTSVTNGSYVIQASSNPTPTPTPRTAKSLTESQIQAIIGLLRSFGADQAIIDNVNNSLRGGTLALPSGTPSRLTVLLQFGIRSEQVTLLQQYLSRNPSIYTGPITGYYGSLTTEAVKKFQKKYNIEQTGVAGPITRGKLMDLWISKP